MGEAHWAPMKIVENNCSKDLVVYAFNCRIDQCNITPPPQPYFHAMKTIKNFAQCLGAILGKNDHLTGIDSIRHIIILTR